MVARLERAGYRCDPARVDTREAFLARIGGVPCDLVLCSAPDGLADFEGLTPLETVLDALHELRERDAAAPFLFLPSRIDSVTAQTDIVEALRGGVTDCLAKSELKRLPAVVERALASAQLVREHLRTQESLRCSEARFHDLFNHIPDALLLIHTMTGTILKANRIAHVLFSCNDGCGRDELAGRHFSRLFPPDAPLTPEGFLERLRDGGAVRASQPFQSLCPASEKEERRPMEFAAAPMPWGPTQAAVLRLRNNGVSEVSTTFTLHPPLFPAA